MSVLHHEKQRAELVHVSNDLSNSVHWSTPLPPRKKENDGGPSKITSYGPKKVKWQVKESRNDNPDHARARDRDRAQTHGRATSCTATQTQALVSTRF